ncbi:MAG: 1-acyl-sn-glycerol-3-phosphate acyltransferase [Lachnospiraceae bacterium]|nr:1-acyl-sn-glycerol-3-phosphate acyltransferase [Lachnospiraceae bacterium]
MKNLLLWFVKITGVLPFLVWYKPAVYHENKKQKVKKTRSAKTGEILIANHTTMMDFAMMLYVHPFRTIRVLMAEVLFKRPLMAWFFRHLRGIKVDRYLANGDDRLAEAIQTLNEGGIVGVFPEGRLNKEGREYGPMLPFSHGAAYLALCTGAKVRPVYFHTVGHLFRRSHMMVGDPVDLCSMFGAGTDMDRVAAANAFLKQKMERLKEELKFRSAYKEHSLITWFTGWSMRIGMRIAYPFKVHYADGADDRKRCTGACIVASNHISTYDPPLLCMLFPKLKLHILASETLYEHRMLGVLLRRCGCIRIDRNILDMEAFHIMQSVLEHNESVGIFPEGGLSGEDELKPFKSGIVLAAYTGNVDIIPVYISKRGKMFRRKGRDIWIGKKISPQGSMTMENVRNMTDLLYHEIEGLKKLSDGGE